jgi:hypothetical protein
VYLAHNIEDCARESMKFDMRKFDFESVLDDIRSNQKALELADLQIAQLLVNDLGFSATQEPLSSAQVPSGQKAKATHRAAGYSEYEQLNEELDLLEYLNIEQHGNDHDQENHPIQTPSADEDVANALKFLDERFSRIIAWFDSKDPHETYIFTPKELIEQFHHAKFIDRSIINIHRSATYDD